MHRRKVGNAFQGQAFYLNVKVVGLFTSIKGAAVPFCFEAVFLTVLYNSAEFWESSLP